MQSHTHPTFRSLNLRTYIEIICAKITWQATSFRVLIQKFTSVDGDDCLFFKGAHLSECGFECIEFCMLPEEVEELKVNIFNGEHTKNEQKSCTGPLKRHLLP